MASLFDKYKAVPVAKLKVNIQKDDQIAKTGGKGTFLKIEPGSNKFKIFPPHDSSLGSFYVQKMVHWVTNAADDGGDKDTYRRGVLNATAHAGAIVDIVDAYVDAAKRFLETGDDPKAQNKIKHLTGRDGLNRSTTYLCYAIKIVGETRTFGVLEFKTSVRNKLNEEACMEDPDDPIEVDPYTDPLEGRAIQIIYNKEAKKAADYYKVKVLKPFALTEEEMEIFDKAKPLSDMNKYTIDEFEHALEGIQMYDDEHEIGLFEEQWWLDEVATIKKKIKFAGSAPKATDSEDDDEETEEEEEQPKQKTVTVKAKLKNIPPPQEDDEEPEEDDDEEPEPEPEEEPDEEGDEYTDLSRDDLKRAIARMQKSDESATSMVVRKSMSDDDIRDMIRAFVASKVKKQPEPKKTTKATVEETPPAGKLTLADIKKKLMKS